MISKKLSSVIAIFLMLATIVLSSVAQASTAAQYTPLGVGGNYTIGPGFINQPVMAVDLPDPTGTDNVLLPGGAIPGDTLSTTWGNHKFADIDNDDAQDYSGGELIVNSADNVVTAGEVVTNGAANLTPFPTSATPNYFVFLDQNMNGLYDTGEDIVQREWYGSANNTLGGDLIALFGANDYYSDADGNGFYNGDQTTGPEVIVSSADVNLDFSDTVSVPGMVQNMIPLMFGNSAPGAIMSYGAVPGPPVPGTGVSIIEDVDNDGFVSNGDILIDDLGGVGPASGPTTHPTALGSFTCPGDANCGLALLPVPAGDMFVDDNLNTLFDFNELVWFDDIATLGNGDGLLDPGELGTVYQGKSTTALTSLNGSTTYFWNDTNTPNGVLDAGEEIYKIVNDGGDGNNVATGQQISEFASTGNEQFSDANHDGFFTYSPTVELIADPGIGTDVTSANILLSGDVDLTGFGGTLAYFDADASTTYTNGDDIIDDADGSGYFDADQLTSLAIGFPNCVDADFTAFSIWEDTDGNNSFSSLADTQIGTIAGPAFKGTSINTAGASVYTGASNERTVFATVSAAAAPTSASCAIQARIPNPNFATFVSGDTGPSDNFVLAIDTVTLDNTSPTPTVTATVDPVYEGSLTQTVTIRYDESMDNGTTPTVAFGNPGNWGGPTGGTWSTTTFTDDTYTVNFTHDGTGEHTLPETITVGPSSGATDLAGNADNGGSTNFGVDTIDPVPTLTSVLPPYTSGTNTITFTATDVGGTGVASTTCSVDGVTFTACTSGDALSTLGGWGGLADGAFAVTLLATDTAGNTAFVTDATPSKDTTAPVTTITSAPTPTNGTQTFTFAATDATSGVTSTTCSVDGVTFSPCTTGDAYSTLTGWGALPEGAFTLTVRTTDGVGLTHDDTAPVTKDTVPPAAPAAPDMQAASDSGASDSDNITNDTTPTFDVVASDGTSTMTLISDVDGTIGTRTGSGSITASVLSEGTHGITLVETDAAGNSSAASTALGVIIDTTNPSLGETTPVADPTSDPTPNLSFSSDEAGTISWAGGCNSTTPAATAATQTITLDADGAGGDLAEATYNCTLTVTDDAGNAGGLALTAFTVDTSIPTGTATVGTDPLYEGDLVQEVTITYDEAMDSLSTPTINFSGTAGTFTSNADGTWASATTWTESFTLSDANEEVTGATVYSSGATDTAGNPEGAPVNGTFDVDTLAPTLTTVTIASDNATDTTTAGVGDTVTLSITGNETIQQPVVTYTSGGVAVTDTPTTYFPAWTAAYTANVADTEGVVAYTIDFTDLAGNNGTQVTATTDGSTVTYDNSAPTVGTYAPADDATGVGISSNLDLTFDDNIVAGTGNVVIYKESDDSVVETIDITTGNATFDGTTGVSINPTTTLAYSTAYYVQVDATAIENTVGLTYAGIADKTTWNFTTAAAPPATPSGGGGGAGGRVTTLSTTTTEDTTTESDAPLVFSDVAGHWAEDYIYEAKDDGYIEGYEDETFKPDQYITRSEAAKLIAMWLDATIGDDVCQDGLFSDVDCASWYGKYVVYLNESGIIEGYEDGSFGPGLYINRAEALKMMLFAKALQDSDIADIVNPFSDVSAEQWFYNYVMVGYKLSIIQGYEDGTFGPEKNITRAEFTKIFIETLLNN